MSDLIELNETTLNKIMENLHLLQENLKDYNQVDSFFNKFPFEKLLNITFMKSCSLILTTRLLSFLSDYKEFYTYDNALNNSTEFIIINLSLIENDCIEISYLLELLVKILESNVPVVMDDSFKNVFDRERTLELLLKLTSIETLNDRNFYYLNIIIRHLLENGSYSTRVNEIISQLFNNFKCRGALAEMTILCKNVINRSKLLCETFHNIFLWMTEECCFTLKQKLDKTLIVEILNCLNLFCLHYNYFKTNKKPELMGKCRTFYQNLLKVLSDICILSTFPENRASCLFLLEFVICEYLDQEQLKYCNRRIVEDLKLLAENVEDWPKADTDIFFGICYLIASHCSLIWKNSDILNSLIRCFYKRRQDLNMFILKSLYFLYPILIEGTNLDLRTEIVGNDLLNYFQSFCESPYIYSYNIQQLRWMLNKAPKCLKLRILRKWILHGGQEDLLVSQLKNSKYQETLVQLILKCETEPQLGAKSAALIRKMHNDTLASDITLLLPLTVHKPIVFNSLILSQPGIPVNPSDAILICTIMGAIMPSLSDFQVLKGACVFSSRLLASLQKNRACIEQFCRKTSNIHHLIDVSCKVDDDDTAIEIIRLLKVVIAIQKILKVRFETTLEVDFLRLLQGTPAKIGKSIKLLNQIVSYKASLIGITNACLLAVYYQIIEFTFNSELGCAVFDCLAILLKHKPFLNVMYSTQVHIEIICLSDEFVMSKSFYNLLFTWLKMMKTQHYNGFLSIPETSIKSFISRAVLQKFEVENILSVLQILINRRSSMDKVSLF